MRLIGDQSHVIEQYPPVKNDSPPTIFPSSFAHRLYWIKVFSRAGLWVGPWAETKQQWYHIRSALNCSSIFAQRSLYRLECVFYLLAVCDPVMGDSGRMVSPRKCWLMADDRELFVYPSSNISVCSQRLVTSVSRQIDASFRDANTKPVWSRVSPSLVPRPLCLF